MKPAALPVKAGIFGLLAGLVALPVSSAIAGTTGASYITTVNDSSGSFASRGVITLNADQTMSVIDSGQGGPTNFFSSQLGSWKSNGKSGMTGRTIDFDYPVGLTPGDVARLDYTINSENDGQEIAGTVQLTVFSLQANPLNGGGTVVGTFTFTGNLITP